MRYKFQNQVSNNENDCSTEVDVWGLDIHHIIPNEIYKEFRSDFKKIRKDGYIQNRSTKAKDKTNLRDLDRPFPW